MELMCKLRHILLASLALGLLSPSEGLLGTDLRLASTVPSLDLVRFEVEFLDGAKAKVTTPLGEKASVFRADGTEVEILPKRMETGEISLEIKSKQRGAFGSPPPQAEALSLKEGEGGVSRVGGFEIRLIGPAKPAKSRPGSESSSTGKLPASVAFQGELILPSGQSVRFATLEGEMLRISLGNDRKLAIMPLMRNEETGGASFRVLELLADPQGRRSEKRIPLEVLDLEPGSGQGIESVKGAFIRFAGIHRLNSPDAEAPGACRGKTNPSGQPLEEITGGTCCCGVGQDRVCGCSVETEICFCCIGGCCGIPWV